MGNRMIKTLLNETDIAMGISLEIEKIQSGTNSARPDELLFTTILYCVQGSDLLKAGNDKVRQKLINEYVERYK